MHEPSSLMALTEEHENLEELFLLHQVVLVAGNLEAAAERLSEYRADLSEHMALEEEQLFPLLDRADILPGGSVDLFLAEHTKIREIVESVDSSLRTLRTDTPGLSRRIIRLLDEESLLKRVMEPLELALLTE